MAKASAGRLEVCNAVEQAAVLPEQLPRKRHVDSAHHKNHAGDSREDTVGPRSDAKALVPPVLQPAIATNPATAISAPFRTSVPRPTGADPRLPKQLHSGASPRTRTRTIATQNRESNTMAASAAQ